MWRRLAFPKSNKILPSPICVNPIEPGGRVHPPGTKLNKSLIKRHIAFRYTNPMMPNMSNLSRVWVSATVSRGTYLAKMAILSNMARVKGRTILTGNVQCFILLNVILVAKNAVLAVVMAHITYRATLLYYSILP